MKSYEADGGSKRTESSVFATAGAEGGLGKRGAGGGGGALHLAAPDYSTASKRRKSKKNTHCI
jgi:hypothetical protein